MFQEVRVLVEILDVNGSGDLDVAEWRRFYNSRRISLSEFGEFLFFSQQSNNSSHSKFCESLNVNSTMCG